MGLMGPKMRDIAICWVDIHHVPGERLVYIARVLAKAHKDYHGGAVERSVIGIVKMRIGTRRLAETVATAMVGEAEVAMVGEAGAETGGATATEMAMAEPTLGS